MNLFAKILVGTAVFFVPFSFGATQPWAFSVLQALVAVAWLVRLCTRPPWSYPSAVKPVLCVFGVLIGLCLVQSCFPHTLLDDTVLYPVTLIRLYTLEHASLFMTYLGLVLLIMQLYPSFDEVRRLAGLLVLGAAAVALCMWALPDGEYIYRLTGKYRTSAAVGPFLNRNHGGMFLSMNALLALGLFFTHQLDYRKLLAREERRSFWVQQAWLLLASSGLMVSVVFTRSRGAMLSLFIGLFLYALLYLWSVPAPFKKRLKGIFYTLVLLVVSSACIYTHLPEINRFSHRATGTSEQTRKMLYRSGGKILQHYPVWGVGIGAMPVVINEYTEYDVHAYIERLHNDWLEILLGVGGAGMLLLLAGLGWFSCGILQALKHLEVRKQFLFAALLSALGAMCVGSTVDFHFFIPGCAFVFFCMLGMTLAPTFHKSHVHRLHPGWLYTVLVLVLLLCAMWIPGRKTWAWRAFLFGKGLRTEGKLEAYQRGLAYYPSPRYAVQLGNAYYNAGNRTKNGMEKWYYYELAQETAQQYLQQYPKEKELSTLYMRARARLKGSR